MKSSAPGKNISDIEILNVSPNGIWLYVSGNEYFMSYEEFPWFKEARIREIYNLELLPGGHLYWPELDVDLTLDSLKNPEAYPLIYK